MIVALCDTKVPTPIYTSLATASCFGSRSRSRTWSFVRAPVRGPLVAGKVQNPRNRTVKLSSKSRPETYLLNRTVVPEPRARYLYLTDVDDIMSCLGCLECS